MDHHHLSATALPTPAMSAPPGQVSDLYHHTNALWKFNVVTQIVCLVVVGTLFGLRCYVRLGFSRMPRQWILEDWVVCLSFIGLMVFSAISSFMMNSEAGVHQWNLSAEQAHRVLYLFWINSILYGPLIFVTKLSILLLYLRLLVPTRWSPLWTTIHIFIAISFCFYFSITVAKIFQCSPRGLAWNRAIAQPLPSVSVPFGAEGNGNATVTGNGIGNALPVYEEQGRVRGHCINLPVVLQVSGLFNTISDALILLVPVKAVWRLRLSLGRKVGVCGVFGIGAVAPIFSAIGFAARVESAPSRDLTFNNPLILLWGTAEVTTGLICACLPALPSLFRGGRPRRGSTTITIPSSEEGSQGMAMENLQSSQNPQGLQSGKRAEMPRFVVDKEGGFDVCFEMLNRTGDRDGAVKKDEVGGERV